MQDPFPTWRLATMTAAHAIHIVCISVWVGGMLFNLVVGVPMLRARVKSRREFANWMADEGTRIAPWLYGCILLTLISGWVLGVLVPRQATYGRAFNLSHFILHKHLILFGMLACHLYGTFKIWPRIFMATEAEIVPLFRKYGAAALTSTTLGIGAIILSAYWSSLVP